MKTLFYTAASLDGFIATEADSLDWLFPLGVPKDPAATAGCGTAASKAADPAS